MAIIPAAVPKATVVAKAAPAILQDAVLPTIEREKMLTMPRVHRIVMQYGSGTPLAMRMYAIATSKAIGTGRKLETIATVTMPRKLTGTNRAESAKSR